MTVIWLEDVQAWAYEEVSPLLSISGVHTSGIISHSPFSIGVLALMYPNSYSLGKFVVSLDKKF